MPRAPEAPESLLADREDDDERFRRQALDDVERDGDGERVVADPGPDEHVAALRDAVRDVGREDRVDMSQESERERRLAELPDEVADRVARERAGRCASRCSSQATRASSPRFGAGISASATASRSTFVPT